MNGYWRPIALFLAGLVVSMASFYVVEFHRTLTRDEAIQLIEQMRPGPPWAQERTYILKRLEDDRITIIELRREITELLAKR